MSGKSEKRLTIEQIAAIERVLNRENRVELIPIRDGIKVLEVRRKEVK